MAKIVRLTESELVRLVKKIVKEQDTNPQAYTDKTGYHDPNITNSIYGAAKKTLRQNKREEENNKREVERNNKDNNNKIRHNLLSLIQNDGMTDKKNVNDFNDLIYKVLNRKPSDNIANIWYSIVKNSSLKGIFPTWEILNLLTTPKQNARAIRDSFLRMGATPEFMKNIETLIKSRDYDRTREQLNMTTLPSSRTIAQLLSLQK